MDASDLSCQSLEGRIPSTLLEGGREGRSILRLSYDVVSYAHISLGEGSIGLLDNVREALADHLDDDALHVVLERADHSSTQLCRSHISLVVDIDRVLRSLWVSCDTDDGGGVVLHLCVDTLGRIDRCGDVGEGLLDLCLYLIHVDIADDHQSLLVWAVPLLVVVSEHLIGEVTDDLHLADRHALTVLITGEGEL